MNVSKNLTETTAELNARYADALLPLTVTLGFFIVLGLIGNLLTITVFSQSREFEKNNFKVFAMTLAVIDTFTCVTLLPVEIITHRTYFMFQDVDRCKLKCFLTVFGASASCLALLVISVDRFQKVVKPLNKQLRPGMTVKILIVVAFVIPIILAVPGSMMCGVHKTNMTNLHGGLTEIYFCETEDKYRYSVWRPLYKYTLLVLQLGISLVYIILYSFVMKEASQQIAAIKEMQQDNSLQDLSGGIPACKDKTGNTDQMLFSSAVNNHNSKTKVTQQKKMKRQTVKIPPRQTSNVSLITLYKNGFPAKTLVWFVLTLIFVVTYMTHLGLTLKVSDIVHMSFKQFAWFVTFFRLYFVNHVINPFIYAIFIKRFRDAVKSLLTRFKCKFCQCA